MGRKPCCDKLGLKRGPWTADEDHKLMNFIISYGILCWRTVPKLAGLLRCGKSCRLRWINYLRPDLQRGGFTDRLHAILGNKYSNIKANDKKISPFFNILVYSSIWNGEETEYEIYRWSKIASHFVGRTDNEIKNHWNTKIKKRLKAASADTVSQKFIETKNTRGEVPASSKAKNVQEGDRSLDGITEKFKPENDDDLLSNYEIFDGSLEVIEHWLNEDNVNIDSQSCLHESLNAATSEFPQVLSEK